MSYIGATPAEDIVVNKKEYIATAGDTVFSVMYDDYVEVYYNGVRLSEIDGEYSKSGGIQITLTTPVSETGDIVLVSGYQKIQSVDASTLLYDNTESGLTAETAQDAVDEVVAANASHTHDGRYYTETEADSRFVNATGGAMTGMITNFTSTGIDDNATSTAVTLGSSGNVGIGTSSPGYKLDVNGTISASDTIFNKKSEPLERMYTSSMPMLVKGNSRGNQAGQVNPFTSGWSNAYMTSNTHEQWVSTGTVWASRTTLEKELLTLMGRGGVQHFIGGFYINRVTAAKSAGGYTFPYQQVKSGGPRSTTTHAAFVKHISGPVPYGWWCRGLVADGNWHFCDSHSIGSANAHYNHTHPYLPANDGTPSVILVALPGTVNRYINDATEWSVFMD